MFNDFRLKLAAAMGIAASTVKNWGHLPPALPYEVWRPNIGHRRGASTRINQARWKCDRPGKRSTKVGHLWDIDQRFTVS